MASRPTPDRPTHVLIVDDNEGNRRVASAICAIVGLSCEDVSSARGAIEAAETGRFDLVLMDICMPGMDGVDAALAIRALGITAERLPIIAVTANADPDDCERYLAAGMCDVVSKPIQLPVLCRAIAQALAPGGEALQLRTALA